MSKCESQLRHFLKTLTLESYFPKQSILNFLAMNPLNSSEFLRIHSESWQYYLTNLQHYREMIMLIYIGLTKNISGIIENALDFVQGMIHSRFIMLIFNQKLEFEGDRILLYLEPALELTVIKGLENGKEQDMLNMLERVNSKKHKFNEIGFILEMIFIKKIQKYLEDTSLQEFNQLLKGFMPQKKFTRLTSIENSLHFRHIALLRQEEDKQQTYSLQFMNGGKLMKLKQMFSINALPNWVQQAFWKVPRTLNLEDFGAASVTPVYCLLSQVEVFASSPLIQQFDCYTRDEVFLAIFQQFLMGLNISSQSYQFHWEKMRTSLEIIRKTSQNQNPCYKLIIAEEMSNTFGNNGIDEANKFRK